MEVLLARLVPGRGLGYLAVVLGYLAVVPGYLAVVLG